MQMKAHYDNYLQYLNSKIKTIFIHSGYFYSASSSLLLLRGAPNYRIYTVSELTRRSATVKVCIISLLQRNHWAFCELWGQHIVVYCISLGQQPVGVQCPLTSSLGEFPGYCN